MSEGEILPRGYRRITAVRARLTTLAASGGTFQEHVQAGILLSTLADSAWWLGGDEWRCDAGRLTNSALDELERAHALLPSGDVVAHASLLTQEAMVRARAYRTAQVPNYISSATTLLKEARRQLSTQMGYLPSDHPAVWHQMAVSTSLLSQVMWGGVLDFGPANNQDWALQLANEASCLFQNERSLTPDREHAYRSHLMTLALVGHMTSNRQLWRPSARSAIASAQSYRDWSHHGRALAILVAGRFGDRQIRIVHEARAVRTLP